MHAVTQQSQLDRLLQKYSTVFSSDLGRLKDFEVELFVDKDARPIYRRARPVAYHLKPLVEKELQRLEDTGVIKPVTHAQWASPTVNVIKSDGKSVR